MDQQLITSERAKARKALYLEIVQIKLVVTHACKPSTGEGGQRQVDPRESLSNHYATW